MGNRCCKRSANANEAPMSVVAGGDGDGGGANPFKPSNRKCTDLLCLLFFLGFWVGMVVIAAIGYKNGEPKRLIYGTDWMGRTCGVKTDASGDIPAYDLTDYPYLIYPRVAEDLMALETSGASLTDASTLKKFFGVCVTKCPMLTDSTAAQYVHAYEDYSKYPDPVNSLSSNAGYTDEYVDAGSPWRLMMDTTEVLYRCMELSKIEVTQKARCVDECSADELAYYAAQGTTIYHCGESITTNPFVDCGDEDCSEFVLGFRPNCTTVQISREEIEVAAARDDPVTSMLSRKWYMVSRWIGDIQKAAFPILICGGGFAMVLGFFWLVLLRYCAGAFVWLVIIAVIIMQLILTLFCAYEGSVLTSDRIKQAMASMGVSGSTATTITASVSSAVSSATATGTTYVNASGYSVTQDTVHYWAIACYVMIALDLLLLVLLIFMCGRIRIAIGIIREASKALQSMPMLTLYPLIPTTLAVGLVAYWLVAAAYIATSANVTVADITTTASSATGASISVSAEMSDDKIVNYLIIYHLFGLLWTNQLIQATAYTVIAGAFCEYYWTLDKRQIGALPVARSIYRTLRYHLGTLAFGSLLIAIVQLARLALEYIDHKFRTAQKSNTVLKVAMMCFKCCLWCFEKCLKFLNKNAFIIVAMKGKSFCPAMKDAFALLLSNALRVATVSIISRFLLILGKLFIAAFSMFFMFLFIRFPPSQLPSFFLGDLEHVSSPIFPMLLTGLLGFTTASFFLDVYGTGIDTILLCFCEDCDVNKGSDRYYMSDELFAYIEGPAKKSAFRAYQKSGSGSPTRDNATPAKAPPIVGK